MKSPRAALMLSLVAGLAVTACLASPAPQSSGPDAPSGAARSRKVITGVVGYPIIAFAPAGQVQIMGNFVPWIELHSNGLVTADDTGGPIPRLATALPSLQDGSMQMQPDGRVTTLWQLRPDVTWHDGTAFTARDLAFGFRAHTDPALPYIDRSAVEEMESVQAQDETTLLILWKRPFYQAATLGPLLLFPLPAHLLEAEYEQGDRERFQNLAYWTSEYIHNGPFRLARYEPGRQVELDAYPSYFLGRPKVDGVIVKEILDKNAAYAAILAGEIDVSLSVFEANQINALEDQWAASGGGKVVVSYGPTFFLAFQFAPDLVSPRELLDARVRRALYFALDRPAIADLAFGGRAPPGGEATGILPPNDPLYAYVKDGYLGMTNDPRRAQELFADAGYHRGADGLLANAAGASLPVQIRVLREQLGTAAASMWKQAGVDTSLLVPPPARAQDKEYQQAYQGVELAGAGTGEHVLDRLDGRRIPTSRTSYIGTNRGHYDNPSLTDLYTRFGASLDPTERGRLMSQISDAVAEDLPFLVTFFNPTYGTALKGVQALDDWVGGRGGGAYGLYTRTAHLWEKRE